MVLSVEVLIPIKSSDKALAMLHAITAAARQADDVKVTQIYQGGSDWLVLYGVGAPDRDEARKRQIKNGGRTMLWDLGYFDRQRYLRCSVDHDHPQDWLPRTAPDPQRWNALGIRLREDYDPDGHIVLVGLGKKSRAYLREADWERFRLNDLRKRFPGRQIIYRPKPKSPAMKLDCRMDADSPIEVLLRGASLISCRHSNVACDAAVAGVPFECDDGAAMWLKGRPFTQENRLEFLRRLAWWQWRSNEAVEAWAFIKGVAP